MSIKSLVKRAFGPRNLGRLDYLLNLRPEDHWQGPFNGQTYRQSIFSDLVHSLAPNALVETGTFRGSTTAYLATFGIPVYSVEAEPRRHAYAALRLRHAGPHVHLYNGDSRRFLRILTAEAGFPRSNVLFYLDAHWGRDLPLREEIETVFGGWREAVVMVDDFKVPGTGYRYDDYGPGKVLDLSHLQPLASLQLKAYFPAVDESQETGARKGCVVLCREQHVAQKLDRIERLRSGLVDSDSER